MTRGEEKDNQRSTNIFFSCFFIQSKRLKSRNFLGTFLFHEKTRERCVVTDKVGEKCRTKDKNECLVVHNGEIGVLQGKEVRKCIMLLLLLAYIVFIVYIFFLCGYKSIYVRTGSWVDGELN